jgi:hypothetical protein
MLLYNFCYTYGYHGASCTELRKTKEEAIKDFVEKFIELGVY